MSICAAIGAWLIGWPVNDPSLIIFLLILTLLSSAELYWMLGCRIDRDGLRSATPTLYLSLLRWEDVTSVRRSWGTPYYMVRGSGAFVGFVTLPHPFFLKDPNQLIELVCKYAPEGHPVRNALLLDKPRHGSTEV